VTTKIIVSYDGTDNDRDALALGRVLAATGASVALAYVRHAVEGKRSAERLAERDAQALLDAGAEALGGLGVTTHVVLSASTPNGLRDLALELDAGVIVFGSEYRTSPGHVDPQASARRLLDGGPIAVALAPAGFHALTDYAVGTVGVVAEDGDPCVLETAETVAARHHGTVAPRATGDADLLVVGSKPGTVNGRVRLSAAADYLIELTRCPVLVLPRGVAVAF
jgi:nucleotide-binding universal stress UspA family protein